MNRTTFGIRFVCAIAVACAAASPARAQQRSGGPFSGLFSGSSKEQPHTLDVRGSVFGAWDDNLQALAVGGSPDPFSLDPRGVAGFGNGLDAGFTYGYHRSGNRSQFDVLGNGSVREFGGVSTPASWFHSYNTSVGVGTSLTPKTVLNLGASASYAPFYQYATFLKDSTLEGAPPIDYGFAVNSEWVASFGANAGLTKHLSKKTDVSAGLAWNRSQMPKTGAAAETLSGTAGFAHNLTRKLSFRLGYGAMRGYNTTPEGERIKPVFTHLIDVGLGYADGLSFTFARYYHLSLSAGLSIAKNGDPASVLRTGKSTAILFTGSAMLSRSIGRTWSASAGYNRGTSYIVGFSEPLMSDTATLGVGGQLGRRVGLSSGVAVSRAQMIFSTATDNVVSYSASSTLTAALTRHLGAYVQAGYNKFSIPEGLISVAFAPRLERRSVTFGLTTWLPIIQPKRGSRDSG